MVTITRIGRARWALAWPGLLVAAVTLALDVRALLPGVGLWDTAEFQAIGPVLGIAHPTGFPSYTLLAWLASVVLQPFGDPAYRANLLSAILAATATGLTATVVVVLTRRGILGVAAGLALAVAPIPWAIGLRADAHALHFTLVALLLFLLVRWREAERAEDARAGRWLVLAAFVFGVSLGNHALTALLAPSIGVFVLAVRPTLPVRRPRLVVTCAGVLAATVVALYAYLPLRSSMDPPLDYGNPDNWDRLRYLVLGEQFRGTFTTLPDIGTLVGQLADLMTEQLGVLAALALLGVLVTAVRRPAIAILTVPWLVGTFVFSAAYVNADITRYHLTAVLVAAVWAALGADAIWSLAVAAWERARASRSPEVRDAGSIGPGMPGDGPAVDGAAGSRRSVRTRGLRPSHVFASAVAGALLLAPTIATAPTTLQRIDSSRERHGEEWLERTLESIPPDAVVVSWWSFSTPLWYAQFVEHRRPDVLVIDDRTIADQGLGTAGDVVEQYLGTRPVLLIRLPDEIEQLRQRYQLRRLPGVPSWGAVWEVVSTTARITPASRSPAPEREARTRRTEAATP